MSGARANRFLPWTVALGLVTAATPALAQRAPAPASTSTPRPPPIPPVPPPVRFARPAPVPPPAARPTPPAPAKEPASSDVPSNLRARFGIDVVTRLLASENASESLRGLTRASRLRTPEALSLLVSAADAKNPGHHDGRDAIEVARALAPYAASHAPARHALLALVNATPPAAAALRGHAGSDTGAPEGDDDPLGQAQLARETAAMALAAAGTPPALEALLGVVRAGGSGKTAAVRALAAHPSPSLALTNPALMTPATIELAVALGDLRGLDALGRAARSMDSATKASAIAGLGAMGDGRALDTIRAAAHDRDPHVRVAVADALVRLEAPERFAAVATMVNDDATAESGLELATRAQDDAVTEALLARLARTASPPARRALAVAVAKGTSARALGALESWLVDPTLQGEAAHGLARSPSAGAQGALERALNRPETRRLAMRALVVRALVRGGSSDALLAMARRMLASPDGAERAAAVFARLALGIGSLDAALSDPDARVRRAAAMATMNDGRAKTRRALLRQAARDADAATRQVLLAGLTAGDPHGDVTTLTLFDRAQAGEADAPLAALALAERDPGDRSGQGFEPRVSGLLRAPDPLVRAHAALGLGRSAAPSAVGRLASVYAYEPNADVRRAAVAALANRHGDEENAPARVATLELAARLDPDAAVRWTAARALAKAPPAAPATPREVTWLRVAAEPGQPLLKDVLGTLIRSDGLALPIVFDDDGYAVIPGVPPGAGRLVLAPRLPAYDAPPP